jgi:hypothetical protein
MSAHTIYEELCILAKKMGVEVTNTHNIKDVVRRMSAYLEGNTNGKTIADAVSNYTDAKFSEEESDD